MTQLRASAARVLYQTIQEGRSLSVSLPKEMLLFSDPRDQAWLQTVCFGVCRSYFLLEAYSRLLLKKPLKAKDHDIFCLLLVGLYQLIDMRIPHHAAVAETVAATSVFKKPWAKKLMNALLRAFLRHQDEWHQKVQCDLSALYSHPSWMIEKLKRDWPAEWESILEENNKRPPFSLRINRQKITRDAYLEKYDSFFQEKKERSVVPLLNTTDGILLIPAVDVSCLPGFAEGYVSVQDGAAQLAAHLLELAPFQTVLDACAAPGGKTAHMLEWQSDLSVVAIDQDEKRLSSVRDNLTRLGLRASCFCANVMDIEQWWDGTYFDRILLDAPCSASGVIRRHPDIKLLRQAKDMAERQEDQTQLLETCWTLLKPGGLLVYATCSIFSEENADRVQIFLQMHPDAKEEPIQADWGIPVLVGRQILPGMHNMDGFYYARLRKR